MLKYARNEMNRQKKIATGITKKTAIWRDTIHGDRFNINQNLTTSKIDHQAPCIFEDMVKYCALKKFCIKETSFCYWSRLIKTVKK